jgi:asparagine synthase (glutamine-hydrolysing)
MRRMLAAMHHRGPDDQDTCAAEGAILGQRRLSIIDLEGGRQPIPNEDRTLWIVCNGEIYNYRSLRTGLIDRGHRFATHSDVEVILHLYEEVGDRCVERLRGMFAFAIWDEKSKRLFAARDRLGQKPFYYVEHDGRLCFASEIKALIALEPTWAEVDLQALVQYLALRLIAPPLSMFRQIRKLPPAHTLSYEQPTGIRKQRYWNLQYEPKDTRSEGDLVDELEERLVECLSLHMESDVPVGAFLSGGLDSSLVVAMLMSRVVSEPIQTFCLALPYRQFDESPYARMVAQKYGTIHHEKVITPSLMETLPDLVWHLDEPSDPLSLCTYHISALAREHVKVVLGGDGGDELFGGYDRYYGNLYAELYRRIPSTVRTHLIGPALERLPDGGWYKSKAHQIKWLHQLAVKSGGERYGLSLSYFYFPEHRRKGIYGPVIRETASTFDPERVIRESFDFAQADHDLDRMLFSDSAIRLPDHPAMILDRMSMAHSLEARSPLMDHEIAEFAARLPVSMKVRGRSLRYIERRLAERYLPPALLKRSKQGFSSALPYMLRDEYGRLHGQFLRRSELAAEGILDQGGIDVLLAEHATGRVDHGNRLWLLLNSELWYRMFIQGVTRDDLSDEIRDAPRPSALGVGSYSAR